MGVFIFSETLPKQSGDTSSRPLNCVSCHLDVIPCGVMGSALMAVNAGGYIAKTVF